VATAILTVDEMRAWEKASWAAGRKESEVIRNVGRILADRALALTNENDRILILAGKGHNGDDARAAVPHLLNRKVKLAEVIDPKKTLAELPHLLEKRPRLIIDALFGIGLNRPLSPEWIELFETINRANAFVLAVDVPSGLNAATGEPEGAAIKAAITLTVGAIKRGMLAHSASEFVGRLELAPEIRLITRPTESELFWTDESDFPNFPPRRAASSHKGTYGHLGIVAGSLGYHGAAVLCARGAQRSQPGLITLVTHNDVYVPIAAQLQSVMVHQWPPLIDLHEVFSALVIGPGLAAPSLSQEFRDDMVGLWKTWPKPIIADASYLPWLPPTPESKAVRVITPHPGEAARMLGVETKEIQSDRVSAVRKLSKRFGNCWVVLKGSQTLIGRATGPIHVNSSGNPYLAQGGSGDLLAGFIGGLLAQPILQKDTGLALRYAVWAHGDAADRLTSLLPGWSPEDLADELR
jgi:hydroxyethylthiazole kinase-like uncharacterized protein yjeF